MAGPRSEALSALFERVAKVVVSHPAIVILVLIGITAGLGSFIPSLRINNNGRIYFIEGDPMLAAQERFEQTFGSEQFVMFFLEGEEIFSRQGYETITRLVERLEEVEYKGRPAFTGILDPFHAPALKPGSESLNIAPILEKENPTDEDLADAKRLVTTHPVYAKSVVNPEGTIAAVLATLRTIDGNADDYTQFIAEETTRIFEETEGLEELDARLVGAPIFGAEMNMATAREAVIYGSASVGVALFALFLLFRRPRQVLGALGVVIFATVWTVGIMAGSGAEMSLIHTLLPPAIIVTGLGSGIHVINEFRLLSTAMPKEEAAIGAVKSMGGPCLLTAVTTGIGFTAMLTAPVAPMRSLGVFIALGVVLSFVLAMLLVPAVLMLWAKDAVEPERISAARKWSDHLFTDLAHKVVANAPATVIIFAIIAVLLISGLPRLEVDSTFLHALRKDHPFRQTVEYVDEKMGGSSSFELVIDTGVENGIYDPRFLQKLAELQDWIESTQGDVVWVTLSIADLFKEINYAVIGRRALPETKAQAAELLFLYDVGGGVTSNVVDAEKRIARLSARTRQMSSNRSRELEMALREKTAEVFEGLVLQSEVKRPADPPPPSFDEEDDEDLIIIEDEEPAPGGDQAGFEDDAPGDGDQAGEDAIIIIEDDDEEPADESEEEEAPAAEGGDGEAGGKTDPSAHPTAKDNPGVTMEIAGTTPLFAKLNEYIISSQMKSFTLAAIIIGFIMMFMLRSAKLGLAIMIPNILPIFATYGMMGWTKTPMDFLTAVIAVAAIGVAVDGTIHIGTRYRRARAAGEDSSEAAKSVMTSVGRALVVTSLVLTVGFLVLIPSMLASLATFGVFMAFCLFLALMYDLIMTPAVLAWLSPEVNVKPGDKVETS